MIHSGKRRCLVCWLMVLRLILLSSVQVCLRVNQVHERETAGVSCKQCKKDIPYNKVSTEG